MTGHRATHAPRTDSTQDSHGTTEDRGDPADRDATPSADDNPADRDATTPADDNPADRDATDPVHGNPASGTRSTPSGTAPAASPSLDDLRRQLAARLEPAARAWLDHALDEAAAHPGTHGPISAWELRLAEAGRRCGAAHADAARVLILDAARADTDALSRVYFQGTADERRAVLHALPHLVSGPGALPLVEDALRTNDTRLLAAATGPYAARHLDPHAWRHAVLKCLFTGVPVDEVANLPERARGDGELARMLADYATERTAAGRAVPEDLHRVLDLTESAPGAPGADHPHGKES
ncbi:EboA domain-containing protein [Streptomyces sp. NPDC057382]|uniref:EboA domain-containing protein n=1 Tax=unclassified Streptomyces TaxID=2593676 RepID=UPI0036356389